MEDKITSAQNSQVKYVVSLQNKKQRDKDGLILLEGQKLVQSAKEEGVEIVKIFSTKEMEDAILVIDKVMKKMATTVSSPEILAIAKKPSFKLSNQKKIILLENIKDAGNLGTIIRCATAFGIEAILLLGDCVDEFSPKVLRSSVGTCFKIPVIRISFEEIKKLKKQYKFISTVVNSKNYIENIDFKSPFILMFGSEAEGLSDNLKNIQDEDFTLPMKNNVESLNLGISCAICMWELSKIF